MQREDYINMLAILERPETLSRGVTEATATALLYQNIQAHIQEMNTDAAEEARLKIIKQEDEARADAEEAATHQKKLDEEAKRESELQDDHGEIDESDVKE